MHAELAYQIHRYHLANVQIIGKFVDNVHMSAVGIRKSNPFPIKLNFPGKHKLTDFINGYYCNHILAAGDFDIFHPTYYEPYFLRALGNKPFVLTIHDMIPEIIEKFSPALKSKLIANKKLLTNKAARIVTVSETTKADLIKQYGTQENKIDVVYHGNSLVVPEDTTLPADYPQKYLLYVGGRNGYKNGINFLLATIKVLKEQPDLHVVFVGGGKFSVEEFELIQKNAMDSRIKQYSVSDELLAKLYANAIAFVFPSTYEGFGIPVIEAFACGAPCILSDISIFREIAQQAAIYFDPLDITVIKQTILSLLDSDDIRNKLISAGKERIKSFSWAKSARQYIDCYEKACHA